MNACVVSLILVFYRLGGRNPWNTQSAPWHKTSVLCQSVCSPLTPENSMVGFPTLQGGFVSPMRAALYARVSTHDQQTLAMQRDALHEFATRRGWTVIATVGEIASGAEDR